MLVPTNKSNEKIKKYEKLWIKRLNQVNDSKLR